MAQKLEPIAKLLNRGEGVADVQAALAAATDTDIVFDNGGDAILYIHNGDVSSKTATLKAEPDPFGRGGGGTNDVALTIPAGETAFYPFMAPAMFNSGGQVTVELSATTSVSVGVYLLTKQA